MSSSSSSSSSPSTSTCIPTPSPIPIVFAPYYGYEHLAKMSTLIITALFPPATPRLGAPIERASRPLDEFIAYALFRTRLHNTIVFDALFLLDRLKRLYPAARGTPTSPHRLFISSLMLASKMLMDDTYSNKSWSIVTQDMFQLEEVNRMERELFGFLNKNVYVHYDHLRSWCCDWHLDVFGGIERLPKMASPSSSSLPQSSSSSPLSSHHQVDSPPSSTTPVPQIPSSPIPSSPSPTRDLPDVSCSSPPPPSRHHSSQPSPSRPSNPSSLVSGSSRHNSSSPESTAGLTTPSSPLPRSPTWASTTKPKPSNS